MCISKKIQRFMTVVLSFVFVLSSLSIVPKTVQAADPAEPKVEVLGGTLRLDAEEGKQSLRVGIRVSNASKAKACGIQITALGKTVKLATDGEGAEKHDALYAVDQNADSIIYTAVITDIPKDYFGLQFGVTGNVTPLSGTIVSTSGTATQRSVSDVVDALCQKDPTITMNDAGILMKGETPLKKDDAIFNGGMAEAPVPTPDATKAEGWTKVDLQKTCTVANSTVVTYDSQRESLSIKNTKDLEIPIMENSLPIGTKISLRIRGYNNTGERFRYWIGGAAASRVSDEKFCETGMGAFDTEETLTTKEIANNANANGKFDKITLKVPSWNSDWMLDHVITGIWYKVEAQPAPKPTLDPSITAPSVYKTDLAKDVKFDNDNASQKISESGEAVVSFEDFKGLYYMLPAKEEMMASKYKHIYISYLNSDQPLVVYLPTVDMDVLADNAIEPLQGNQEKTKKCQTEKLVVTGTETVAHYSSADVPIRGFQIFRNGYAAGKLGSTTLTIKSIVFSEKALTDDELAQVQKNGALS